jgi:hypothetical protein
MMYCAAFAVVFGLLASAPALAAVKVGAITSSTGEVSVLQGERWTDVTQTPFPIYSSNKIRTRNGKARIEFEGGGELAVNYYSMLEIKETQKTEGLIFRETVRDRRIKLLVGEMSFEVSVSRDQNLRYRVKTPTMTAAVRGSKVTCKVTLSGVTYSKTYGDVAVTGWTQEHSGQMDAAPTPQSEQAVAMVFDALELIIEEKGAGADLSLDMTDVAAAISVAKETVRQQMDSARGMSAGELANVLPAGVTSIDQLEAVLNDVIGELDVIDSGLQDNLGDIQIIQDQEEVPVDDLPTEQDASPAG